MEKLEMINMMVLSTIAFLGGYIFTVLRHASAAGMEPWILINGSLGMAAITAILNAGIVGGWTFVMRDQGLAIREHLTMAESIAATGSFLFGTIGIQIALWLL